MDILKVVGNDAADGTVTRDEVSKAQTPRTLVSTHLTNDELAFCLGFCYRLVYLLQRIDALIVHSFQSCLGICNKTGYSQQPC